MKASCSLNHVPLISRKEYNSLSTTDDQLVPQADAKEGAVTALVTTRPGLDALSTRSERLSLTQIKNYAQIFMASGLFKDTKSIYQAMVKIQAGNELGFPPFAAMNMMDIIEGKVEVKPIGMRALIRRDGKYDYSIDKLTNDEAAVSFYRIMHNGERVFLGTSTFTQEDAKRALLADKGGVHSMYKKYPRNMLVNRATANGTRWFCPDITATVLYMEGELTGQDAEAAEDTDFEIAERPAHVLEAYDAAAMFMTPEQKEVYQTMYWDAQASDDNVVRYLSQFIPTTTNQEDADGE